MPTDLTGIQNENEFYTHHYLHEVLTKDLKEPLQELDAAAMEEGGRRPYERLRGLKGDYFNTRNQLEGRRDRERALREQRDLARDLLRALGYDYQPHLKALQDEGYLPVLGEVRRPDGTPALYIVEAPPAAEEEMDPLTQTLFATQYEGLQPAVVGANVAFTAQEVAAGQRLDTPLADLITRGLFTLDEAPRLVLVVSLTQVVLMDRTKWDQKRLLRFDLGEILALDETPTLQATAALLHRRSICPEDGLSLLDTLDENAHKHAFAVSEDLKYALRESIELIGNEAIWYLREKRKKGVFSGEEKVDATQLTRECLRYMYRLLFLFYIEARPELGFAPMDSDEYLKGYSLESLRDLELVEMTSESARNGFFLHHSLELLFNLIYDGYPSVGGDGEAAGLMLHSPSLDLRSQDEEDAPPQHHTFTLAPLRAHLFDPARIPTLRKVKFRNHVLQRVLELMSLSNPDRRRGRGTADRRGRIDYAALGINQLGAVYEALLSYAGFFAEDDLYEVKKAGETYDELEVAYFVPREALDEYTEEEIVYADDGAPVVHEKGTFIYRLSGRERQQSASYYTPEVLTRTLVKYALKELIGEAPEEMKADDILDLTVCEPAMGSGAFLNEAINQLAEAYLQRKQKETGEKIHHDHYAREKQKVKMYLADRNVYGVDLNPVATELAEVSLWLNTIYEQRIDEVAGRSFAFVPWFGMQLATGNSLIGARRQVYAPATVTDDGGRGKPAWMETPPHPRNAWHRAARRPHLPFPAARL